MGREALVETDHKPLETILKKPLYMAPLRLQRMLVQLQHYPGITVVYKKGETMYFADTLSRAYLNETIKNTEVLDINLVEEVISDVQLLRFSAATKGDEVLSQLGKVIVDGWPETRDLVPAKLRAYWNFRDELTVAKGLVLKGSRIVVPKALQAELLERIHEGHMGITKTLRRAREAVFWPGMSAAIIEKIENCSVCLENQPSQQRERLKPHEIPPLPWAKVGTDILHKNGHNYIIVVDYYSKWPELTKLNSMTSSAVITNLKSQFARYGIPKTVVSDNGPCYTSSEFTQLARDWGFHHTTSSPGYPRSNGQAERTMKSVKAMLEKAKDPYLALLAYRNTPVDGIDVSPAQLLMGRRLRSTVPQTTEMLKPESQDPQVVHAKLMDRQLKQKEYHDKSAKDLAPLMEGETVRVRTGKNGNLQE